MNNVTNQYPKITYRSDSTNSIYKMTTLAGSFKVEVYHLEGHFTNESGIYEVKMPWRLTVNHFFDIVDNHINKGEWL